MTTLLTTTANHNHAAATEGRHGGEASHSRNDGETRHSCFLDSTPRRSRIIQHHIPASPAVVQSSSPTPYLPNLESNNDSSMILYACIVREDVLLVHAGDVSEVDVNATVRHMLQRPPNLGWDFYSHPRTPSRKGVKFHVYTRPGGEQDDTPPQVWSYACVYDPKRGKKKTAQAFLVKLLLATEVARLSHPDWCYGDQWLACQTAFGPTLRQHMGDAWHLPQSVLLTTNMLIARDYTTRNREAIAVRHESKSEDEEEDMPWVGSDTALVEEGPILQTHQAPTPAREPLTPRGSFSFDSYKDRAVILPTPPPQPQFATIQLKKSLSFESVESTFMGDEEEEDDLCFLSPTKDDKELSPRSIAYEGLHTMKASHPKVTVEAPAVVLERQPSSTSIFSEASGIFENANAVEAVPWCRRWGGARKAAPPDAHTATDDGPCFFLRAWFSPRPSLLLV
jgi:hypothetical protein